MNVTRVACGQFEAHAADKQYNLKLMSLQINKAANNGCNIIVFPELIVSGYLSAKQIPSQAEQISGSSVSKIRAYASSVEIAVAFGMVEADHNGNLYDSMIVVNGSGEICNVYRKLHLFGSEKSWAMSGDSLSVFCINGVPTTGWICFDTRFPELARDVAVRGAEIALVPAAWLGPPEEWVLSLRARALDNSMFVAGAGIINFADGLRCHGNSLIAGPHGEILARADADIDCVIWADLDPTTIAHQRNRLALLENRRKDIFKTSL